ncbi:MFS transporter [Bradyrhizobium genosp. A]|uniref:MFS transporter n=1 Tax=Bradyrhizobium genosp. A TaxID=83626 RepID=UPI003CEEDB2B
MIVGLTALLTLIDLFGPQAIAPALTTAFRTTPAYMGIVINAATVGMAISGFFTACIADRIERKPAMIVALLLLSIPTFLLGRAPDLMIFAALRILQGLLMCASFTVAIAYVAEEWGPSGGAPLVMAAYVTGNVGSNLLGRVLTGSVAQYAGWRGAFVLLAAMNLAGGILLWIVLPRSERFHRKRHDGRIVVSLRRHLRNPRLRGAYGIGFLILFSFIGIFTYVNFLLARPPFSLAPAAIGALYSVFLASLLATPAAGPAVRSLGSAASILLGAAVSLGGVLLTLCTTVSTVMAGLALVGVGTFFCQAVATGFVGKVGGKAKAAASGLYLACYYSGGICGALLIGLIYDRWAWPGCVAVTGIAFVLMALIPFIAWREAAMPRRPAGAETSEQG